MVTAASAVDTTADGESVAGERYARWCVITALAITFVVCIPLLFVDSAYDDDWAWVWVHYWQGADAIQDYMWMIAHPGFGPILNFFFWVGGDVPGRAAHIVAVFCHLCSGWLLWQIFRVGRNTAPVAAGIAIAYLTAPFVAGIRASFAHDTYDVFIVFYLLSIWLSARTGVAALVVALVSCVIGLSLETLMSLEAMRWLYLYQCGYRGKSYVARVTPYLVFAAATVVLRLTVLLPTGYTTGHNEIEPFSIIELLRQTRAHLAYYPRALEQLQYVPALVKTEPLLAVALALAAGLVGFLFYRIRARTDHRDLVAIAIAGVLLLGAGALPYIAAHRPPVWTSFYSRLAVASQFGVYVLGAVVLEWLDPRWLRAALLAILLCAFAGMEFQFGKWALYDEEVMQDFQAQLSNEYQGHPPELLYVHFRPTSASVMYIGRCLANYDINVAIDLQGKRNGSYAYDADCQADEYTAGNHCGVTGFGQTSCPPAWMAEYVLKPGMSTFSDFRFIDLARNLTDHRLLAAGDLIVDRKSGPGVAGSMSMGE